MKHEIQKEIPNLLSAALAKCGALADAEDLVQETLLAALEYLAHGGVIEEPSRFLHTVLNRRFYDMLRRKYRLPTVSIGEGFDIMDDEDFTETFLSADETESVRREVSYLAASYREIITAHYFYGKSVSAIADRMGLPVGTVKSRLDFGRKQMKKGLETMKNYEENSYRPKKLYVANSGMNGMNEEPGSLVNDDVLAQNILLLAYQKPVTISALSRAIGVAAAYVEPIVKKLVDGELMVRMGDGKVYTDFIIFDADDGYRYVREAESLVHDYAQAYCIPVRKAIEKLKTKPYYSERLERYMLIHIASAATWKACVACRKPQIFPERPNGGKWIAFGWIQEDIPRDTYLGKENYALAGERVNTLKDEGRIGWLRFCNYESALYPYGKYDGMRFSTYMEAENATAMLLYLIYKGIDPKSVNLDSRIIEAIPLLAERGYLDVSGEVPRALIPCLSREEARELFAICDEAAAEAVAVLEAPFTAYTLTHRKEIPAHLTSVPDQKLSMSYDPGPMMFVFEAIERGLHPRDLGYPCPECILVTD